MKKKLIALFVFVFALSAPVAAFAQVGFVGATSDRCNVGNSGTLGGFLCKIGELLNSIVPVLIALAVVMFVWGVVMYVISDDEEAKAKGRDRMIWGIVGLAVIIGMWGLVSVLRNTFGVTNSGVFTSPTVPVVIPQN